MRQPAQMKIVDPNAVLTVTDKRLLENMIGQQLEYVTDKIDEVRLMIERRIQPKECQPFPVTHIVLIETQLASGEVVRYSTSRVSKGAALMVSVDRLKEAVVNRMSMKSSRWYRLITQAQRACHLLVASVFDVFNRSSTTTRAAAPEPSPRK